MPGMLGIEALTPVQKARFPEFVERWQAIGLSTAPTDRRAAEHAIRRCYEHAGIKPPEQFLWLKSPLAGALAYNEGYLQAAVHWLRQRRLRGLPVLVHCHAGVGRSGSLVVAYLSLFVYPECAYDEVVARVNERLRAHRHSIYPHVGLAESVQRLRQALLPNAADEQGSARARSDAV